MKSSWTFGTLHICELCIHVLEFAHFPNFCRFSKLWNSAHLVNSAGVAARRPPREAAAAPSILQCARPRSNKESVFCRKLSKIYPPCQNPDRSSYRLLNRLTRVARVFHQMKWADGSKTFIFRAEQNGAIWGNPRASLNFACSRYRSGRSRPETSYYRFLLSTISVQEGKMIVLTYRTQRGPTGSRSCCHSSSSHSSGWKSENKSQMLCIGIR